MSLGVFLLLGNLTSFESFKPVQSCIFLFEAELQEPSFPEMDLNDLYAFRSLSALCTSDVVTWYEVTSHWVLEKHQLAPANTKGKRERERTLSLLYKVSESAVSVANSTTFFGCLFSSPCADFQI